MKCMAEDILSLRNQEDLGTVEDEINRATEAVSIVTQDRLYNIKTWMPRMTPMPFELMSLF